MMVDGMEVETYFGESEQLFFPPGNLIDILFSVLVSDNMVGIIYTFL